MWFHPLDFPRGFVEPDISNDVYSVYNSSEAEVTSFWDHIEERCDWFDGHPAASWPTRSRLASIGTYGDEVQAYRNSECGSVAVVAWTSELAYLNDSMTRYFPIAIWSEHHESEHTYNDCMKYVVQSRVFKNWVIHLRDGHGLRRGISFPILLLRATSSGSTIV